MIRRHQLPVFLIGSIILGSLSTTALAGIPSSPPMLLLIALPISYIPALLALRCSTAAVTVRTARRFAADSPPGASAHAGTSSDSPWCR